MKMNSSCCTAARRRWRSPAGAGAARRSPTASIKIGVLNDQSGLYADLAGPGLGGRRAHGGRGLRRREARA